MTDDEEAAILCLKMQQTTSATMEAGDALDSPGSVGNLLRKRKLENYIVRPNALFKTLDICSQLRTLSSDFLVHLGLPSAIIGKALRLGNAIISEDQQKILGR